MLLPPPFHFWVYRHVPPYPVLSNGSRGRHYWYTMGKACEQNGLSLESTEKDLHSAAADSLVASEVREQT